MRDDEVITYIGLRADENRKGFISAKTNIKAAYPFIEDGINKRDVHRILEESGLGFPEYYKWRTRSGCYFCFFQQKIEWVGLAENHPELFEKARSFETVDEKSGTQFTWTEGGTIDKFKTQASEIRDAHEKAMSKKQKLKNGRLIDVMREVDPFEEADTFEQVVKEQGDGEGCLICHL